jgi:hypothetical protein
LRDASPGDARSNPVFQRAEQFLASIQKEIRERGSPTNPELLQEKYPAAVWHLLDALKRFASLDPRRVMEITFELARLRGKPLTDTKQDTEKSSCPPRCRRPLRHVFSFQHFPSCLMYAGFKGIAPDQDTGMDLNEPWLSALGLFNRGK